MATTIDLLNQRLLDLEEKVYGTAEPSALSGQTTGGQTLVETVEEIEQKIKSITLGKDKYSKAITELRQIEEVIQSIDTFVDPVKSKIEQVLAFTDEIQSDAASIEQITELESSLNSFELPNVKDFMSTVLDKQESLLKLAQEALLLERETTELLFSSDDFFARALDSIREMHNKLESLEDSREESQDS